MNLHGQSQRSLVYAALNGRKWLTLDELSFATGGRPASVSARVRDLRKEEFGGHTVARRQRISRTHGLYEYRLLA